MNENLQLLAQMCWEFFKTGMMTIGGLGTLPFLREFADKFHWYTIDELMRMAAVSQSLPGAFGVNIAVYAGYTVAGVIGAIVAIIGTVAGPVAIAALIIRRMDAIRGGIIGTALDALKHASSGMVASAVAGLIAAAVYINGSFDSLSIAVLAAFMLAVFGTKALKLKIHPAAFILLGALVGLLVF